VKSDKELGGQNFDSMKVEVARFFNAFDKDGSIRGAIREMGLGNHPALVRLAFRAAKLFKGRQRGRRRRRRRRAERGRHPSRPVSLDVQAVTQRKHNQVLR
jgi:hypothetical protein